MPHKNIVHDLFVSFLRLYIMKRKVKGLMLFLFLTQIDTDAYVPLAQTSITSAYANGAQATYGLRWDTDVFYFYLCLIRVNPVYLWFFSQYLCLIRVNPVHLWLVIKREGSA